ncbi:transferase [Streptomyces sp. NRRL F-5755]|uniref:transferase n=1 Tax=Streptomyces sp. NRRL F-5755 TaxID=1519475 RepID=UPI0006B027F7|nr:transferase [Streptomyces sp. NRRL F-5755]KOT87235.1 transferase [Streptomyces sp. NRRL F-5755]
MPQLILGDYLSAPRTGHLAHGPYGQLEKADLAEFLRHWTGLHRQALTGLRDRIHPTAQIHPSAIIGDDVIIGPHARVHEFSTVRDASVLCAGARVGFNCEVTRCFLGEHAVLGHRIGINRTLVGADAHLSATLTVAAISLWNTDLRHPDREIIFRVPDGLYRYGTPRFGGILGDRCQTGNNISLGPGIIAIGPRCRIASGVTLAGRAVPADSIIAAPHTADTQVRQSPACGQRGSATRRA